MEPLRHSWQARWVLLLLCASASVPRGFSQQWQTLTPLPEGYQEHVLLYANGFLYHLGGASQTAAELNGTNVFYSKIFGNGTIGPWNHTMPLPDAVFDAAGVADNGFVYLIAGNHYNNTLGDFVTNIVYYAKINGDGSLGAWNLANPLPYSAYFENAAVWNHRIYVMGGWTGFGDTNAVFSASIQPDGSLSSWLRQVPLPTANYGQAEVANGVLYTLGGAIDLFGTITRSVNYSRINGDGSLASWVQTTPMPQSIFGPAAVARAGRLFVIGGWSGSAPMNTFNTAPVKGDGIIGAWLTNTPLPLALFYHAVAADDSHIYVSGGAAATFTSSNVYSMTLPLPPAVPTLSGGSVSNGSYQFILTSTTNIGFGIQASTNLNTWANIGWGFTDTNGVLTFQDTNAAAFSDRFYRAYWPLP